MLFEATRKRRRVEYGPSGCGISKVAVPEARASQDLLRQGVAEHFGWILACGSSAFSRSDGSPDIVATHHEQSALTVMIGDGRGGFTEASGSPFDFGASLFHLIIADVDRDGRMDVVATSGNSVRALLGDGRGAFKPAASIPVGPGAWRIAAADLNGDGAIDVVTSNSESNSVSVLLGRLA